MECIQHRPAVPPAGHRIAERTTQPLQNAGGEEELADLVRLALQHLLDQVVEDVAVIARKVGNERAQLAPPLHRQGRQLQGGYPALGAAF